MIWVSKSKPSLLASNGIRAERLRRVGAVSGVELGQLGAQHAVLEGRQDPVADACSSGMPPVLAAPGTIIREPNTASHSPRSNGRDHVRQHSGAY